MPLICSKLINDIKLIRQLQTELLEQGEEFLLFKKTQKADRPVEIKKLGSFFKIRIGLSSLIKESREELKYFFIVKDAINPYTEVFKENGITAFSEKGDIEINLKEIFDQDLKAYRRSGCDIWADSLPESVKDLNLTQEQSEILKSRVELGEIPIVMPGRLAQIRGLMQAIKKLKPKYIENGEEQEINDTSCWNGVAFIKLIAAMEKIAELQANGKKLVGHEISQIKKELEFVIDDNINGTQQLINAIASLPEHPYIFTSSTSQNNDIITRNKTVGEQVELLKNIQDENLSLGVFCQSICEGLALQNRFTERAQQQTDIKLKTLAPLDDYSRTNGTGSCYVDLPVLFGGIVLLGYWRSDMAQLSVDWGDDSAEPGKGFRVVVRI